MNSKNINVIIEGHGGDEMFGGYGYNIFPYHIDKVHKFQNNINSRLIYAYNQMKNKKFNFDEYLFILKPRFIYN